MANRRRQKGKPLAEGGSRVLLDADVAALLRAEAIRAGTSTVEFLRELLATYVASRAAPVTTVDPPRPLQDPVPRDHPETNHSTHLPAKIPDPVITPPVPDPARLVRAFADHPETNHFTHLPAKIPDPSITPPVPDPARLVRAFTEEADRRGCSVTITPPDVAALQEIHLTAERLVGPDQADDRFAIWVRQYLDHGTGDTERMTPTNMLMKLYRFMAS